MSKAKNPSIGSVECPLKGCTESCDVFRYRERGDSPVSVANRRFAGKVYLRCPTHGRVGGDAGDTATQEYILTHAHMLDAAAAAAAAVPKPKPPAPKPKPARRQVASVGEDDDDGFGFFR